MSDVKEVWSQVRDRLEDVVPDLPQNVTEPEFEEIEARAFTKFVALQWNLPREPNYNILNRLAKDLKEDLRAVAGTEKVELFGDSQEEIIVKVDSAKLAALNLNLKENSYQKLSQPFSSMFHPYLTIFKNVPPLFQFVSACSTLTLPLPSMFHNVPAHTNVFDSILIDTR